MLTLLTLTFLHASPIRGEVSFTMGGGVTSDTFGLGPHLGAEMTWLEPQTELGVVGEAWGRSLYWPGSTMFYGVEQTLSLRGAWRWFSIGLLGDVRTIVHGLSDLEPGTPRPYFEAGPVFAVVPLQEGAFRLAVTAAWMPVSAAPDRSRLLATLHFGWRWLALRLIGGTSLLGDYRSGANALAPHLGLYVGMRYAW